MICRAVYQHKRNFLSTAIKTRITGKFLIPVMTSIFWVLFTITGTANLSFNNNVFMARLADKLALLLAGAIFVILVIFISTGAFDKWRFCLMNKNDPICVNEQTGCFDRMTPNRYNRAIQFGLGAIVVIQPGEGTIEGLGLLKLRSDTWYLRFKLFLGCK